MFNGNELSNQFFLLILYIVQSKSKYTRVHKNIFMFCYLNFLQKRYLIFKVQGVCFDNLNILELLQALVLILNLNY
jgi:hypothetical protein